MKKNRFFYWAYTIPVLLLIGVFFGVAGGASAYGLSTATFIPPSLTPTQFDSSCPVGTPLGWGTYTPSSLWMIECEHCFDTVTPTINPTSTVTYGPGTASPTGVVVTSTASPTLANNVLECVTDCDQISPTVIMHRFVGSVIPNANSYFYPPLEFTRPQYQHLYIYYVQVASNLLSFTNLDPIKDTKGQRVYIELWGTSNRIKQQVLDTGYINHGETYSWDPAWQSGYLVESDAGDSSETVMSATVESIQYGTINSNRFVYGYEYEIWISTDPIIPGISTPTPTPTPSDTYCGSVVPFLDDFGWDLFEPDGEPNCEMGWDEFEVGDTTIPPVEICLQPVRVGVVRLFAQDYEMGIFFLAICAAFLWRYMRTA